MRWKITQQRDLLQTIPFTVEEVLLEERGRAVSHPYYRLKCSDWVNILPITDTNEVILIRQDRIGSEKSVLELPGGMVDPHEANDPTMAAVRELEEETGYTSQRILSLGSFNPNPAIQTNRIHFFLALNCQPSEKRKYFPDPEEKIEISFHKPKDLDELVRFGHLDHALSGLCVYLAQKYIDIGAKNWA